MTKSQEKALADIRRLVERDFPNKDRYEIKKWEINDYETFCSLVVEYGLIGDEGTMAEIFGRDRAHLYIGRKGTITYPVHKQLKNGKFKWYTKDFRGYSILQAVCDQWIY